ncbi:hypothetical protein AX17_000682 [Amanita inopinata Kibby_2008]|nr:hypothetical protein AX17_000682 [Amanita inopinata Kibby_2008]
MAERLNNLVSAGQHSANANPSTAFNPRSVAVEIRTPEELAAVNDFLVTLGRDMSGGGSRTHQTGHTQSHSQLFSEPYFDPVTLGQLGLTGMPGLPGGTSYNDGTYTVDASQNYASSNSYHVTRPSMSSTNQYAGYASNANDASSFASSNNYGLHTHDRRPLKSHVQTSGSSYATHHHYHHPTPPLETNSPHSTASTPGTITPPEMSISVPENSTVFDYLRPSTGPAPVAHLAPVDYTTRIMRQMVPLRAAPGEVYHDMGRPKPMEPKITQPIYRGPPAKLTSLSLTSSAPLYPSLNQEDDQYKLPPLNYRSTSPPSRETTPSSTHSSPSSQHTVLPSLRSIASPSIGRSSESEELANQVDRIEIKTRHVSLQERQRHAALIRDLLVSINTEYRRRFGTPGPVLKQAEDSRDMLARNQYMDVEMTAA